MDFSLKFYIYTEQIKQENIHFWCFKHFLICTSILNPTNIYFSHPLSTMD